MSFVKVVPFLWAQTSLGAQFLSIIYGWLCSLLGASVVWTTYILRGACWVAQLLNIWAERKVFWGFPDNFPYEYSSTIFPKEEEGFLSPSQFA